MAIVAKQSPLNSIPDKPTIPDKKTRLLRAQLIWEEALETIQALGCGVEIGSSGLSVVSYDALENPESDLTFVLDEIIDGCCDTIYVAIGTMIACGVPDLPHLTEVNLANNRKFPEGKALFNSSGKYQKPEGWIGPDHSRVMAESPINLKEVANQLIGGD
jgi:predicted HAD superfamily Cof-like phosphohydrolase